MDREKTIHELEFTFDSLYSAISVLGDSPEELYIKGFIEQLLSVTFRYPYHYRVFDIIRGCFNDELLVLDPHKERDLEYIESYAKSQQGELKDRLKGWVDGYKKHKCRLRRDDCPITKSPVCCRYCSEIQGCIELEDTPVCPYVALDEDCE